MKVTNFIIILQYMKNLEDIKELKDACLILGLNPSDFIETSEVQKGVGDVDYKALYEEQKRLNIQIIEGLGNLPNVISEKLNVTINEVQKSVNDISDKINVFEQSPLHRAKSCTKVNVIEKSVTDKENKAKQTYSLSNPASLKALKNFLGEKTIENLEKGVSNSIYEQAAIQLDATKNLNKKIADKLFEIDKIQIMQ
ncbi:hypothetical protein DAC20_208 [Bacteroides phage DAC20]|nr:hypothetical protein DAC19_209 [Bacteroides phage DAC19]QIG63957.1 hypothetical protein DAC20_208 [Bacteroides phage DAC20]